MFVSARLLHMPELTHILLHSCYIALTCYGFCVGDSLLPLWRILSSLSVDRFSRPIFAVYLPCALRKQAALRP
jgi:hypothetical protein